MTDFLDCTPVAVVTPKSSLTLENPVNKVLRHLRYLGLAPLLGMPEVFVAGMPGVFVVGSQVWTWVYPDRLPLDLADVDIIITGTKESILATRQTIVSLLGLSDLGILTAPSMSDDKDAAVVPGKKYGMGLSVVDIWGMADIDKALQQFPEHKHASSRVAFDCQRGCLIVYPNTAAVP